MVTITAYFSSDKMRARRQRENIFKRRQRENIFKVLRQKTETKIFNLQLYIQHKYPLRIKAKISSIKKIILQDPYYKIHKSSSSG